MNEGCIQYADFVHMRKCKIYTFDIPALFYTPRVEHSGGDQRHVDKACKKDLEQFCILQIRLIENVTENGEAVEEQGSRARAPHTPFLI